MVVLLYVWLTLARQTAVSMAEIKIDDFVKAGSDPVRSHRIARNLSNQFEAPVFALFAAAIIYSQKSVTNLDIWAAWVFLVGRVIHTAVQTLTYNVVWRGQVFTINFAAIGVLMAHAVYCVLIKA